MYALALIVALGFITYFSGLATPFQGDDEVQITSAVPVHSISNIVLFFRGGTSYAGQGVAPMSGVYYRPLMTTVFSLLYTIFGPNPLFFHLFQLLLIIAGAFLTFLVFKYTFPDLIALTLAILLLVHPLNSQAAFAIPAMQEPLYYLFGILSLWLLLRYTSTNILPVAAACLFLSLLSKESGVLFAIIDLAYLFIFDKRRRLYRFALILTAPLAIYLWLRIAAVGLSHNPHFAPIDNLNVIDRLLTAPSIVAFFIGKLLFPVQLASAYYWTYTSFSIAHVLIPLVVDLIVISLFVYGGRLVKKKSTIANYYTYIFFGVWAASGLLIHLQLIPLDMTVCETWFRFSVVGVLGMVGLIALTQVDNWPRWTAVGCIALIALLGIRTAWRGTDWRNEYVLAQHDIAASPEDYSAYSIMSADLIQRHSYADAAASARRSISLFPAYNNYFNLGVSLAQLRDYQGAYIAYRSSLKYGENATTYENLAALALVYGDYAENKQMFAKGIEQFPSNYNLWLYLALLEAKNQNYDAAKSDIATASKYGQVPPQLYTNIMTNKTFDLGLTNLGTTVSI